MSPELLLRRYLGFAPVVAEVCVSGVSGWVCPLLSLPLTMVSSRLSLSQPSLLVSGPGKLSLASGHLASVTAWQACGCVWLVKLQTSVHTPGSVSGRSTDWGLHGYLPLLPH